MAGVIARGMPLIGSLPQDAKTTPSQNWPYQRLGWMGLFGVIWSRKAAQASRDRTPLNWLAGGRGGMGGRFLLTALRLLQKGQGTGWGGRSSVFGGGINAETSLAAAKSPHFARAEATMIARRPFCSD
jgi:hypothetical protein